MWEQKELHLIIQLKTKYLQYSIIIRFRKRHILNSFESSGLNCTLLLNPSIEHVFGYSRLEIL